MTDILGMMDYIQKQGDAGRQQGQQTRTAELYAQAMQAPVEQRPALLAQIARMSPGAAMDAQKGLSGMDADGHVAMAQEANQFLAVQQMGDPAATQQAYSRLVQHARALRFPVPDQYDDRFLPGIQKLATAGQSQQQLAPHVIGTALVDNTGKVLYQGQGTPKAPTYVDVPDGQGGSIKMQYDPESGGLVPLRVGGGQQPADPTMAPGPATQAVNGQPFYDSVLASIGPLGGILGSTTGGQHNVGSLHPDGRAVDIPLGASASPEAKAHAEQMMAALKAQGFIVRDERTHPAGQAVWSGPHLHVEAPGAAGRLGYNPPKAPAQQGMFRSLSPQEVQQAGLAPGTVAQIGPNGQIHVVGSTAPKPADSAKAEKLAAARADALDSVNQAISGIDSLTHSGGFQNLGTFTGDVLGHIPHTQTRDAQNALETVKNQVLLTTLGKLKALSATGASGFGALSNQEGKILQNSIANLETAQTHDAIVHNLRVIQQTLQRAAGLIGQGVHAPAPAAPAAGGWSIQEVR
jgi:hypothetical protein